VTAACHRCQRSGPLRLTGPTETTVGSVAVLLEARPVVGCPSGHATTPPEVVAAAMEAVEQQVPRARRRWRGGDRCGSCRDPLTMPVRRTRRTVTAAGEGLPVVTLHLDLPLTRCPGCGLDQLPTRSQEDLVVSIPAVFADGGLP
jgi:hypothetical protein